jgi:two-component system response regulator FlrC
MIANEQFMPAEIRNLVVGGSLKERLEIQGHLSAMGIDVTVAPDMDIGLQILAKNHFHLVVVIHDPGSLDALDFLQAKEETGDSTGVVVLARKAAMEDAAEAMNMGALDFRLPPWSGEVLGFVVKRAMEAGAKKPDAPAGGNDPSGVRALKEKKQASRDKPGPGKTASDGQKHRILTRSPVMERLLKQAESVAKSRATCLIQGESGTGKELLARFIHAKSDRASGPFVALNCAALPETLLESELFGHEKGAFSGAVMRKAGKFELADGGTLLLDEVTEMAFPLQAKLLRVLQEGEVDRLGGTTPVPVDVRIVATTNRDVLSAVRAGKFREDLYFRLNVIPLKLPPLRERREDIGFLARHFMEHFVREYGKNGLDFANGVLEELEKRKWSGNVRELKNIIERGVLLATGDSITLQDLLGEYGEMEEQLSAQGGNFGQGSETFNLGDMEKEMVRRALSKTKGNRTHAARLLGISVRTLRNKLAEYRKMGLVL